MIDQIRPAQLAAWFEAQRPNTGSKSAIVLDVREPVELRTASVRAEGANAFELRFIPMNEVPARLAELDSETPIAVMCHHGARSQRVAMFLASNGFDHVANIAGGIDAWSQEIDDAVARY
ncbi:MAG: sulfurtransferase [Ramlibacter sp.]|nr:sulfurtransferase [Ramlibacter sp.]